MAAPTGRLEDYFGVTASRAAVRVNRYQDKLNGIRDTISLHLWESQFGS